MDSLPPPKPLTDYTSEEVEQYLDAHPFTQTPNVEDPDRGDFLAILANGAKGLPERAFSEGISL